MGLEEAYNDDGGPYYEAYGGASKSYYACSFDPALKRARLIGVVITASWTPAGLTPVITQTVDFGAQFATSSAIKY